MNDTERRVERETCKKCGGDMGDGVRLENTPSYGVPDFPGDDPQDRAGQTVSMTGPVQLGSVRKCKSCGHSYPSRPQKEGDDG